MLHGLLIPIPEAKKTKLIKPYSWTYIPSDAPAYKTGHTINLSGQIGVMTLAIFGILYCTYENKVRAAGKRDHRLDGLSEGEKAQLGYRHPEFRYMV